MRDIFGPPLKAAALSAFICGLILLLLNPPSLSGVRGLLALLAGALAIVLLTAWATVALIGREMPEPEFRRLVDRSEALRSFRPRIGLRASSTSWSWRPSTICPSRFASCSSTRR